MSAPLTETILLALIAGEDAVGEVWKPEATSAMAIIQDYAREVQRLRSENVALIVLPENLMRLDLAWREAARGPLVEADRAQNTDIVMGFNTELSAAHRKVDWVARANSQLFFYSRRQVVPGLETGIYERGSGPLALIGGVTIAICKDL